MLQVFIPACGTIPRRRLNAGSAIVGDSSQAQSGKIRVYFEGNIYQASNIKNFADRVMIAASRLIDQAPTTACGTFDNEDLILIGQWDPEQKKLFIDPDLRHELDYWSLCQLKDSELIPSHLHFPER